MRSGGVAGRAGLKGSVIAHTDTANVDHLTFQVSNDSKADEAVSLVGAEVIVRYSDADQFVILTEVTNASSTQGWTATWLQGTGPCLQPGERVEIMVGLQSLGPRLSVNTEFTVEVLPCFTPGTLIATPKGERLVEDLEVGDRVITRDNGIQEIRWIGRKELTGFQLARKPHLKPVLIQQGALGKNLPEHDLLVSPNHRVLVANDKTALYFEEREVLAAAKHLTGLDGVDEVDTLGVTYIHMMFDNHEVVLSNGAWTESFQPGDLSLRGIGDEQRQEIFELFPELEHAEGLKAYGAARRSLKKHEAQLLTE